MNEVGENVAALSLMSVTVIVTVVVTVCPANGVTTSLASTTSRYSVILSKSSKEGSFTDIAPLFKSTANSLVPSEYFNITLHTVYSRLSHYRFNKETTLYNRY